MKLQASNYEKTAAARTLHSILTKSAIGDSVVTAATTPQPRKRGIIRDENGNVYNPATDPHNQYKFRGTPEQRAAGVAASDMANDTRGVVVRQGAGVARTAPIAPPPNRFGFTPPPAAPVAAPAAPQPGVYTAGAPQMPEAAPTPPAPVPAAPPAAPPVARRAPSPAAPWNDPIGQKINQNYAPAAPRQFNTPSAPIVGVDANGNPQYDDGYMQQPHVQKQVAMARERNALMQEAQRRNPNLLTNVADPTRTAQDATYKLQEEMRRNKANMVQRQQFAADAPAQIESNAARLAQLRRTDPGRYNQIARDWGVNPTTGQNIPQPPAKKPGFFGGLFSPKKNKRALGGW